jgi:hypothetical protein
MLNVVKILRVCAWFKHVLICPFSVLLSFTDKTICKNIVLLLYMQDLIESKWSCYDNVFSGYVTKSVLCD